MTKVDSRSFQSRNHACNHFFLNHVNGIKPVSAPPNFLRMSKKEGGTCAMVKHKQLSTWKCKNDLLSWKGLGNQSNGIYKLYKVKVKYLT